MRYNKGIKSDLQPINLEESHNGTITPLDAAAHEEYTATIAVDIKIVAGTKIDRQQCDESKSYSIVGGQSASALAPMALVKDRSWGNNSVVEG